MARRRSSIRTVNESLQEQFLERVRQVADEPTLALPEPAHPNQDPRVIASLRRRLRSGIPWTARFDKGLLGALWAAKRIAAQDAAPRLLDARVDGNRRFYLQRGHVARLCTLGVQNWDDPMALMLAYAPLAQKHHLLLFAGSRLWAAGPGGPTTAPEAWLDDLAHRTGLDLRQPGNGSGRDCPHADRPRVALTLQGGTRIRVCGACGHRAGNVHTHLTQRFLCDDPATPVAVDVDLAQADATARPPIATAVLAAYRAGRMDEAELLDSTLKAWRQEARSGYVLGGKSYADQAAFLAALDLAPHEVEPVRRMTAGGHVGEAAALADVLGAHRDRLPAALDAVLPGEGAAFAAQHPGVEARTLLRLAHEEAQRRQRTRDLPAMAGLGPLGAWIDQFARQARTLSRADLLHAVRKEVPTSRHPAHLFAFLCAMGLEGEGERSFNPEQRDAGRHWAPLARAVLAATGNAYRDAVLAYLRETGAGESA